MIYPFIRSNLDILFVGLNPSNTSSRKGHYFSTNPSFWNQLYEAGLILKQVDMNTADDIVFGSCNYNFNHWEFGVTDLVNFFAQSDSSIVKPTHQNCVELCETIKKYEPKSVVILHSKVVNIFLKRYLGLSNIKYGRIGKIIKDCNSVFYNIPFPHGNAITSEFKVKEYKKLKENLFRNSNLQRKL